MPAIVHLELYQSSNISEALNNLSSIFILNPLTNANDINHCYRLVLDYFHKEGFINSDFRNKLLDSGSSDFEKKSKIESIDIKKLNKLLFIPDELQKVQRENVYSNFLRRLDEFDPLAKQRLIILIALFNDYFDSQTNALKHKKRKNDYQSSIINKIIYLYKDKHGRNVLCLLVICSLVISLYISIVAIGIWGGRYTDESRDIYRSLPAHCYPTVSSTFTPLATATSTFRSSTPTPSISDCLPVKLGQEKYKYFNEGMFTAAKILGIIGLTCGGIGILGLSLCFLMYHLMYCHKKFIRVQQGVEVERDLAKQKNALDSITRVFMELFPHDMLLVDPRVLPIAHFVSVAPLSGTNREVHYVSDPQAGLHAIVDEELQEFHPEPLRPELSSPPLLLSGTARSFADMQPPPYLHDSCRSSDRSIL